MSGNPVSRFFRALGGNFLATLLMLFFRRSALRWLSATPMQFLVMLVLSLAASFCFDVINEGWPGEVQLLGFAVYLMPPFFMTVFGVWLCQRYAAWRLGFAPVVAWLGADIMLGIVENLIQFGGQHGWLPAQSLEWTPWIYPALFFWPLAAVVTLFGRALGWRWWQDSLVAAFMFAVFFAWFVGLGDQRMWEATAADDSQPDAVDSRLTDEEVFYAQPELLAHALDNLQAGRPGQADWYFVGLAGDSYQNVFRHEVETAHTLFDTRFGTAGRSLVLINNDETALTEPIATRTSLERSLQAVAGKMNGDEDVLFLFLTSHGSANHEFELSYEPLQLDPITPEWLRATLDKTGIKHRVIAISACYSGGFIPALSTPDTVVVTASDATHTSFGCSDDADYTYFGRAFMVDALAHQHSIVEAFNEAKATVRHREQAEGFEASNPQLFVGSNMVMTLPALEARLFPAR
jgi:hypothetical protein